MLLLIATATLISCADSNPLLKQEAPQRTLNVLEQSDFNFPNEEEVYVSIYSDIYHRTKDFKVLLTATLSIRNTSKTDTLFLKSVDYYNTAGDFVHDYLKAPVYLKPLETIDYVIDEEDDTGGSGANFLIYWGSNKKITPIFESIMVGGIGSQGITFTAQGLTVFSKQDAKQIETATVEGNKKNLKN